MSAYRFLESFRSTWADDVLSIFSTFGSLPTLAALVIMVVAWMAASAAGARCAYWLAAVVFSQVLVLAIQLATRHLSLARWPRTRAFPGNHVAATVVTTASLRSCVERRVGRGVAGGRGGDRRRP